MITSPDFFLTMGFAYLYWMMIFMFVGMYRTWFASSRFDELSTLFKSSFVGIFILFAIILFDDYRQQVPSTNRFIIFVYWGLFLFTVSTGRVLIRSFQRRLLIKGIGRRNAVIIGYNPKANNIHNTIHTHPALGLDVVAYVAVKEENIDKEYKGIKVVDVFKNIDKVIDLYDIHEIIIALEKHEDDVMMNVIAKSDEKNVRIKIVPDLYDIIGGQARTSQIYGFPLIDVMPQLMPEWEKKMKRLLDIIASFIILIISFPVVVITSIAIKIDSPGPVFFRQERSGLNGKVFKMVKFRSMRADAEKKSGPMWSVKDDPRITRVGRFIRKVRIDEIPQMYNVLKGEMSLVGPRPERPYFVEKLAEEIPLYKRRLKVRPGVTGWAQVKHKYDEDVEDVKVKLRYDLFYIENISLRMDIKILLRTIFVVLLGKGHFE
ncbi:MAG: undecaprenyl-phosphate glucose phosphotransferase [Melioribacteraceae bacterium]|nr:MAG: undecaprenyl-phosphate glucose phosphotransferase [Melioribacteraceae bacterium]